MSERRGLNQKHLKDRNRGLVLKLIASGRMSRSAITRTIGLTKMAVTNIVSELISEGYIEEKEIAETSAAGRNPVMLDVVPYNTLAAGVYLSRSNLQVIITDLKLNIIFKRSQALSNETAETITDKLYCLMDDAMFQVKEYKPQSRLLGIGISTLGPLDSARGVILRPTNFFEIKDYPIVDRIRNRYPLPVFLCNDMDASALAEKLFGQGVELSDFLYLGITNGIGSGILSRGMLYQNNSGLAGEIGHMSINFNGDICSCGNKGCLEVYANMPVIMDRLRRASGNRDLGFEDFERISSVPSCDAVFKDMTGMLSVALVNVVNLLNPECIIIGHEGVFIPSDHIARLESLLNSKILSTGFKKVSIVKSSFGSLAPLFGSVSCVYNELFVGGLFK